MSYKRNRIDGYNKSIIKFDQQRALLNNEDTSDVNSFYKELLDRYALVSQQLTTVQSQIITINELLGIYGTSINFNNESELTLGVNRIKLNASTTGQTLRGGNASDTATNVENKITLRCGPNNYDTQNRYEFTNTGLYLDEKPLFLSDNQPSMKIGVHGTYADTIELKAASTGGIVVSNANTSEILRINNDALYASKRIEVTGNLQTSTQLRVGTGGIRLNHTNSTDNNQSEPASIDFGQNFGLLKYDTGGYLSLASNQGIRLGWRDSTVSSYAFQNILQTNRTDVTISEKLIAKKTFQTGLYTTDRNFEDSEVVVTFPVAMASVPAIFLSFDHTGTLTAGGQNPPGDDSGPDPYYLFTHHNIWDISTTGFKCQYGCIKYNFGGTTSSEYRRLALGTDPNAHKSAIELKFDTSKTINFRWFAICE